MAYCSPDIVKLLPVRASGSSPNATQQTRTCFCSMLLCVALPLYQRVLLYS